MAKAAFALVVGAAFFIAVPAFAQVNFSGMSALTISANPSYPAPNSVVQLTVESPLLDLQESDVEWTVNGNAAGSGQTIKVPVGALGKETNVSVSVSGATGSDSAQMSIVPTSIDLVWEADSYVPPFYKGRAVPGSNSSIRVLAVPHFVEPGGGTVASSGINFTWKLNNAVDEAQSGVGESSAVFPAAVLYGSDVIEVDAQTPDGSLSGSASITVPTEAPQLVLYEDSPLFGVMYHAAIGQSSVADQSETSFAAVPYFANASSANDPSLAYAWSVNGSSVATDPKDPSEITINAQSSGTADVALSVSNPSDPFFGASGSWQISFSGTSAGNGASVFNSSQ